MSAFSLRRLVGVASALAMATVLFAGCSDDDSVQPPDEFAPPSNLAFDNRESSVALTWSTSFDDGNFDEFLGYNVYRDTAPMTNLEASELAARQLNANTLPAGTTSFTDMTPAIGTKYYYGVRAVRDNGDLSVSSNEVDTALPVQGDFFRIYEFSASGPSGFNVPLERVLSMVTANADSIEFYLGTDAEDDGGSGNLLLKSPSLVSDNAPWNTRVAGLKVLAADASSTSTDGFNLSVMLGDTAEEVEDLIIAVKLPPDFEGETHYAKIEILEFDDDEGAGERSIVFTYAYQPVAAYPRF